MEFLEKKISINLVFLTILILIAVEWLGVFEKVERWFSHGEWATVQLRESTCVEGVRSDFSTYDCEIVEFYSIMSNKIIDGKCVRSCQNQLRLLTPGVRYRLVVTNYPIIGKRILHIDKID